MERAFFLMELNPGFEDEYDRVHEAVWPSVLEAIRESGIKTYSIFRDGTTLHFYVESEDFQKSMEYLGKDPEHSRWNQVHRHFFASTMGPTSGEAAFAVFPEVFRFVAPADGDGD